MDPIIGSLIAGGISAFGGGSRIPAELRPFLRMQTDIAQRLYQQGTGIPLSDPGERAALASQRALLGQQQNQQSGNLMAAYGANPGAFNTGDFLSNLSNQQTGQQMALSAAHLFQSLQNRRNALLQAAQVGQNAAGLAATAQPSPLPQLLGNLAQTYAFSQAMKRPQPVGAGGGGVTPGAGAGAGMLQFPAAMANVGMGGSAYNAPTLGGGGFGLPTRPEDYGLNLRLG